MSIYIFALGALGLGVAYIISRFIFDILLRGFAPIVSSRPWAINILLFELKKERIKANPVIYSLSCGKSGFLSAIGKEMPGSTLIGIEHDFFAYILERIQIFLRKSSIKVFYHKNLYKLDISNADLIYCYLDVEILRELPRKFKFECKPGAIILSNGFPIPNLTEKRSVEITAQKRKFAFLSKRASKAKESKRANMIYIYEI